MPKFTIEGKLAGSFATARTASVLRAEGLEVTRRETVVVSRVRGGGADTVEIEANDDSILVLHLDGGFQLFCRHDRFREDFPKLQRDDGVYRIDPRLGLAFGGGREVGDLILKALEVFDVKPHESVALALAAKVERQLEREPGLYRASLSPQFSLFEIGPAGIDLTKPALIFIHGTASSSRGSFKALSLKTPGSNVDFAAEFNGRYGGNVFAFEHKTLTESPIQNALQLATALPANAELHLVTHSRGGLVGDLLTLGQLSSELDAAVVDALFEGHSDGPFFQELMDVLKQRRPRITRYVRVACPARGTTLVSGRADRWFSMLLSLLGKVLDHLSDPVTAKLYEALQDFLMAVAHERTDPAVLPGLEAMLPSSALVRLLNLPEVRSGSDLSVIAGSTEGKDFLGKLKLYLPDAFYGGEHDLVVNVASMNGGVGRKDGRAFADRGTGVNHLSYFFNASTRQALMDGLGTGDGFVKFERETLEIPSRAVSVNGGARPVVFVLPGFWGSELWVGDKRIWIDYSSLVTGGLSRLAMGSSAVRVEVLNSGGLIPFLGESHEVVPFPYDWRLSLEDAAGKLAEAVGKRTGKQPLRIVGQGSGGLVARLMMARNPELPIERLVMMGTPNEGSQETLRVLTGQARIVRQLSLLDPRLGVDGVLDIVSGFPGLLELLPPEFFEESAWAGLDAWILERVRGGLSAAAATRKVLDGAAFDERMFCVGGEFPGLLEVLERGSVRGERPTGGLAAGPGARPTEVDEMLPNERDLVVGAMGGSSVNSPVKAAEQRIRVEVVHGNLAFARHTVAVGHYAGDSIVGAEEQLDQHLDGRLSVHNQLGVYPDRIGTAEVFLSLQKTSRPSGAVVMGLGKVGGLTPQGLQQTYYNAMLRYALAAKECQDDRFEQPGSNGVTTLLVGTMANVLTIEESLIAMLRGVRAANTALDHEAFRIVEVELMELWEDRAILTAEAVARIAGTPEMKDVLDPVRKVTMRDGGLRRSAIGDEEAWWGRLRITQEKEEGPLKFALFTNRARTEVEELAEPQRATVLIESAMASPAMDPGVSKALFEMLVPNRLKEYAPEMTRLVLMVDANSARYPWELLHDRMGRHTRPLAVDTGLIRQLELDDYRPVVVQSDEQTAMVVANPVTTKYASLSGAEDEGRQVLAALKGLGVAVTGQIHSTGAEIRRDLYTGSYRILHLAGHGVAGAASGMVIGDDDFLTAAEIGQLRPVPELVFLNCCHLGRTDVVAANLAVEFIKIGVRAVIAAGWAVDDAAAATFATQFYGSFLDGVTFGEAVREAREVTFRKHESVNTWGAYQCYGDPGYRFTKAGRVTSQGGGALLVLPSQLALEIDNLASRAKAAQPGIEADLKRLLEREDIDKEWWDRPDVQASLGNLQGELGNYWEAIGLYEKAAMAAESSTVPIRTIEQESNLRSRAAARDFAAGKIGLAEFLKQIERAIARINVALSFGETSERWRIKASAYKRWATFDVEGQVEALREMTAAYREAERLSGGSDAKTNWLMGSIVLRWFDATAPVEGVEMEEAIEEGRRRAADRPSFWNAVIEADGRLVDRLAAGKLTGEETDEIGGLYRMAVREGSSPREVATVVEHLEFIGRMAERAGRAELGRSLERVVDVLR